MGRWLVIGAILSPIVVPVLLPILSLLRSPAEFVLWSETDRLLGLFRNSVLLTLGTLALALPPSIAGAALLFRTTLPGRRFWLGCVLLSLLVPLPLVTSAWQSTFGSSGWFPWDWWNVSSSVRGWTPWGQGFAAAIWIHAWSAIPWCVAIIGLGLLAVEPDLEELSLLERSPLATLWAVSLRRAGLSIATACLWVGIQTSTEIAVTDMMRVRTFAEEVYTQSIVPEGSPQGLQARLAALVLPQMIVLGLFSFWLWRLWERRIVALRSRSGKAVEFPLGRGKWFGLIFVGGMVLGTTLVPVGSLVWRAGADDGASAWSAGRLLDEIKLVWGAEAHLLGYSLLESVWVGSGLAGVAVLLCWLLDRDRLGRWILFGCLSLLVVPGPLVGLGVLACLFGLSNWLSVGWIESLLIHGPSLIPLAWVDSIRYLPVAILLLWPTFRLIPTENFELVRLEAEDRSEWHDVVWPWMAKAVLRTALLCSVLALGEVSASLLVSTPGLPSFSENIFTQMHYGVTNSLAARSLLLLGSILVLGLPIAWLGARFARSPRALLVRQR